VFFQEQKELKRTLLDPFTRSRQLQKRQSTSLLDPGSYRGGCNSLDPFTRSRQPQWKLLAHPTRSIYSTKGDWLYKTCWYIKATLDPPHSPLNPRSEHTDKRGRSIYSTNWSLGA